MSSLLHWALAGWCVLLSLGAGESQPKSAEEILGDVLQGERLAESGRLCFEISADSESVADDLSEEVKQTQRVEYAWAPKGKFRLVLFGEDGPIRTIVSDGKGIDTGKKIWDARFAFDYSPHWSDENFDLGQELRNLMWPYSQILHTHLHPATGFRNTFTLDTLKALYRISIVEDEPPQSDPETIALKLQMPRMRELQNVWRVRQEQISYVCAADEGIGAGMALKYERTGLREIEGVGWIPVLCTIQFEQRGQEEPVGFARTELCANQPNPAVDAAEFRVDYKKSPMIPWPHGSRMKNFWYGIVNTFKDLWEGISDGAIGD